METPATASTTTAAPTTGGFQLEGQRAWVSVAVALGAGAALVAGFLWWKRSGASRAEMELLSAARLLVANLAPEVDPARQVEALAELLNKSSEHDAAWKAFEAAGGPEAVVQLFLAIDPACPSSLPSTKPSEEADASGTTSASSTSPTPSSPSTSETASTSDDAAVDSAPAPVVCPDSAATEESTSTSISPSTGTSTSTSTSTSQEDQEATPATTAVVDSAPATVVSPDSAATEESTSTSTSPSINTSTSTSQEDQGATPSTATAAAATTTDTTTTTTTEEPPSLMLQLARTMQIMSVRCTNRALVTSTEVAQKVAALYDSAATDTLTKVACVSYMAGLVMHNEAQPFASTPLRAALCRFVTETTLRPGVDSHLFTYSIYIFNRVLALTTDDKRYSLRSMLQKGLASHVLQQLQFSQQDQEFEGARHALMETVVELASYADVAMCRQILDAPLAACCVREMVRRMESSEWQAVADVTGVLKSLLSERTAPFRPARQRFQEVFVERGGEVSAATGRDSNVTGLDALVDVLNQGIPPLAPYVLATLTSLCDDNVNVQEALRNNERAMDALRRITEARHPGHDQAQDLLLLLSLHHQAFATQAE